MGPGQKNLSQSSQPRGAWTLWQSARGISRLPSHSPCPRTGFLELCAISCVFSQLNTSGAVTFVPFNSLNVMKEMPRRGSGSRLPGPQRREWPAFKGCDGTCPGRHPECTSWLISNLQVFTAQHGRFAADLISGTTRTFPLGDVCKASLGRSLVSNLWLENPGPLAAAKSGTRSRIEHHRCLCAQGLQYTAWRTCPGATQCTTSPPAGHQQREPKPFSGPEGS